MIDKVRCSYEDCNEKSITTFGKLDAPICYKHVVVVQKALSKQEKSN